jgi:hypothetical protein
MQAYGLMQARNKQDPYVHVLMLGKIFACLRPCCGTMAAFMPCLIRSYEDMVAVV